MLQRTPLGERIRSGEGPEFSGILEALDDALTVRDLNGQLVYANLAARRALGFDSLDDLTRRPLGAVISEYRLRNERDEIVTLADFPSERVLRGEPAEPLLLHSVNPSNGEPIWQLLKASPLLDRDGQTIAAVTMVEDVTAVKMAEVRTRVLAESGRLLAASLDYQQTLRNVAHTAIPALADWCMVELLDRDGCREQIVIANPDAAARELAVRMRELEPSRPRPDQAAGRVVASGESLLFGEITDAHLARVAHSPAQLAILHALHIRSAIVVPMRVASRTIGVMSFFTAKSRRRFTEEDQAVAEQLGRRAAVAVENARLHTQLAEVADTLTQSLLPAELPEVPGWEIAALYRPAQAEQPIEVGGDFYEVFEASGTSLALIGDVTGHGVAAATVTALMRHGARFASRLEPDPVAILRRLDEALRQRPGFPLCSALCAALNAGDLVLCSAGHPPALIVDRRGTVTEAPVPGPLLGAFPNSVWEQQRVAVAPGDLVLMYTDGVTEMFGATERFGSGRLRRLLSEHAGASPSELVAALDEALERFHGVQPTDDVAALALAPVVEAGRS